MGSQIIFTNHHTCSSHERLSKFLPDRQFICERKKDMDPLGIGNITMRIMCLGLLTRLASGWENHQKNRVSRRRQNRGCMGNENTINILT